MPHTRTSWPSQLGPAEDAYLGEVTRRLVGVLGENLVAIYLTGSAGLDDWVPGRSDLDIMAICDRPLSAGAKRAVVRTLSHRVLRCPARCLELVVYAFEVVRAPGHDVPFEVNFNTGYGTVDHASFRPGEDATHWFVIDVAITRTHGRVLLGPPPPRVIGAVPRLHVRAALRESLRWHAHHAPASADTVLNACRAWRYTEEGVWSSKSSSARWALTKGANRALIDGALECRHGSPVALDPTDVCALLGRTSDSLAAGRLRPSATAV